MRVLALGLLAVLVSPSIAMAAQQQAPTQSAPPVQQSGQAVAVAAQMLQALGTGAVSDVTLTGAARRIAGSDDEEGTVVLKALATGEAQLDLSFPSGPRSEVVARSDKGPIGKWTGSDGKAHAVAQHNLAVDSAWFFPALMLRRAGAFRGSVFALAESEMRDGRAVEHLVVVQRLPNLSGDSASLHEHLSQMDIYVDSSTLLPVAVAFNAHPNNNVLLDILVEIRYSDYRAVNSVQTPFHIQKYMNNSLVLDLQFQAVNLNTGLTPSSFNAQ